MFKFLNFHSENSKLEVLEKQCYYDWGTFADSPLTSVADEVITVHGKTKWDDSVSLLPLSTLFFDTIQVLLDALIVELMRRLGVSEEDTFERYANVE